MVWSIFIWLDKLKNISDAKLIGKREDREMKEGEKERRRRRGEILEERRLIVKQLDFNISKLKCVPKTKL